MGRAAMEVEEREVTGKQRTALYAGPVEIQLARAPLSNVRPSSASQTALGRVSQLGVRAVFCTSSITTHIDLAWNTHPEHLTIDINLSRIFSAPSAANAWVLLSALCVPIARLTIDLTTIDVLDSLNWVYLAMGLQTLLLLVMLRCQHFIVHRPKTSTVEGALRSRLSANATCSVVDV
ncbi:hypothetical protein FB451DRAFT_1184040 [Mycena latifolia]|nr:hypothetical protein FB451DRAFT_1184040 [Mycena latifolia]